MHSDIDEFRFGHLVQVGMPGEDVADLHVTPLEGFIR